MTTSLAANSQTEKANLAAHLDAQQRLAVQVDRLLKRYEQSKKNENLYKLQVQSLTRERDLLKSRIESADQRLTSLLMRLPSQNPA